MHQNIEAILLAFVAAIVALVVTQCGADDPAVDDEPEEAIAAPATTTSTTLPPTTTTTIAADTLPVSVAPVLATDDPDAIAYCLATSMVSNVLVTGVRGDIDAVQRSIDRRSDVIRTVVPPEEIATDIETVLVTSDMITTMLGSDDLALEEKRDRLAVIVTDETFRSSVSAVAQFEADTCMADPEGAQPTN